MSSNTPVYVAGFDLGVLPIGACDISITLSIFSSPFISLCFPGFSFVLYRFEATALYSISFIKLLFPDPDTPVIHVSVPNGNFTFIFFKLFSLAPFISKNFLFPFLLFQVFLFFFFLIDTVQ